MVKFEQFKEIELKVAKILEAERMEGSDKLLKLKIDIGEENPRQLVAGIGKAYTPEEVIGREIIVVANLEPRMLMSLESQGMLLAASDGGPTSAEATAGKPVLLRPDHEVPPGSTIS